MLYAVGTIPRQIAYLKERTMVHFQVATGPAQVRIGEDQWTLYTQVSGLWIVADMDCYVNIIMA